MFFFDFWFTCDCRWSQPDEASLCEIVLPRFRLIQLSCTGLALLGEHRTHFPFGPGDTLL
jgi:hypothetical protein